MSIHTNSDLEVDPRVFWVSQINAKRLQTIAAIARDIFAIPVSSAPVERVFSVAGVVTANRCNMLAGEHLEQRVLMSKNSSI